MTFKRVTGFIRSNIDAILVALSAVIAFWNAIGGEFVWDDKFLIANNPFLSKSSGIGYWFKHFYMSTADQVTTHFYRPLSGLSFSIDAKLWGAEQTSGYHVTNLLVFAATSLLLFLLVKRLSGSRAVALVSALLFSVHPVHSESVAWISGRTDLLCGLFSLLSIWLFICARDSRKDLLQFGSVAAFAAAMLSKEVAIVALPFLFAVTYLRRLPEKREPLGTKIRAILPYLAIVIAYLCARQVLIMHSAAITATPTFEPASFLARLAGAPVNIFRYLRMFFVPTPADPSYSATTISSFTNPVFLASIAGLVAILAIAFAFRKRAPLVLWSVVWFFAALLPALNIIQLPGTTMAERFMYLPSLGVCTFVGILLVSVWRVTRAKIGPPATVIAGCCLVMLIGYIIPITWQGNSNWASEFNLWSAAVKLHPQLAYAHNGLGVADSGKALDQEAIEEFRTAIKLKPDYAGAHVNLADALAGQGNVSEAIDHYRTAIEQDKRMIPAYQHLAQLLIQGDPPRAAEAAQILEKGVSACPNRFDLSIMLAELYLDEGKDLQRSADLLEGIIKLAPDADRARLDLGKAYARMGRKADAKKQLEWIERNSPNVDPETLDGLRSLL